MARLPKVAHLALIASLLGGAAIVPVVLSGQASAQSGARICGRVWVKNKTLRDGTVVMIETIYKIYEINKDQDNFVCLSAEHGGGSEKDPTLGPKILTEKLLSGTDWKETGIGPYTCEEFTANYLTDLEFKEVEGGPKFSNKEDTTDICNNMNRSENIGQMKAYWSLYSGNTDEKTWFIHG